jgi:large subunit ribosomal protein L29
MKAKEIREMSADEIRQRIEETERDLDQSEFQHVITGLEDPLKLRRNRRTVARMKTILKEKEQA